MKQSHLRAIPFILLNLLFLASGSQAAVVGPTGYFNDFTAQPLAVDWATLSRNGAGNDTYDIDADVTNVAATAVSARTALATADPAAQLAQATWSSVGLYLQTRPTGNRWTALMGKFVNNTGTNATEINLSYLFTVGPPVTGTGNAGPTTNEETGLKVYFSLTGQTNSWVNLAFLNNTSTIPAAVTLSTNVPINWTNGGTLFLLWVDDNASQGTDPGNQIDNFSLAVTAGFPPPMTLALTAPANNGLFLSTAVPSAAASVTFGTAPFTVQYFLSSGAGNTAFVPAGTSGTPPYNVNLGALTPGTYNLYAVVTDSAGVPSTATSSTNTFAVADPITVTLDSPANNSTFDNTTPVNGSVTLSGGTAPYSVQFYLDNTPNGAPVTSSPFQRNFGALFVGDHAIKATVTDSRGWVSNSAVAAVHITGPVGIDLTPTNGSSFNFGQPVTLTAAPGGGTGPYSVTFFTNDVLAGTVSASPFTLDLGILPVGSFTSYAHVTDSSAPAAQQANSPTNIIAILPNPTIVTLTSPTNGQSAVSGQPLAMSATASALAPVNVSNVEFFFDGVSLGIDNTAPYSASVPSVTDGTHVAYALATDSLGRKTYSPTNVVTSVLDPLANDNFANRFTIGTPALVSGSNVGATLEPGEPAGVNFPVWGASLWYKWTPPITGRATITINAPFQLVVGAYAGTDVGALTLVGNNINGFGTITTFSFNVVGGTDYSIQAAGFRPFQGGGFGPPATGSFQFQLSMPPTVTITSPTNRSVFPAISNVLVSATALPAVGTITSVQFYRLGSPATLLATVSNAPYEFVYSNSIPGTNSLVALATDSVNQTAISTTVNVAFFSDGVTLVTPADGTVFQNTNPIRVGAVGLVPSGSITNVEFFADDVKFAQSSAPPFTNSWTNVTSGPHRLSARGTDDSGNSWQSTPIFISVAKVIVPFGSVWKYLDDNSDQGTAWIAPSYDDSTWASGPAPLGFGDSNGRPEATTNSFGPDPNNKYITTYYRQTFNATEVSAITNYSLTIERDDGAVVYLNGVEVGRFNMPAGIITKDTLASANAQDDGGTQFTISVNPALLLEGPNVFAVEIHQDAVTSSDTWFQMQLIGIPPVIRNAAPSVSISNPLDLANFLAPLSLPIEAIATDSDGSVTNVQFFVDGVKIGEDATSPYSVSWDSPPIGAHVLTAVATDDRGASRTSAGVNVKIYDAAGSPFAKITAPLSGTIVEGPINIPVTATASALDSVTHVEFFANGASIGDAASSPYGIVWSAPFGINSLTAVAYGADGKTGTSVVTTVTVTIPPTNTIAPFVASQNPPAGSVITSLTNIQVTFSERVQGVTAGDLLINGIPATGVTGSGSNYNFTFPQPPYFEVSVTWDANHGITDFGYPSNLPFDELAVESRWEYDLIDRTPPIIVSRTPAQNAFVTNLATVSVKFSEPVSGVDASDLLVNGTAATAVTGDGTNFTFTVLQPGSGTVTVSWSSTNNIFDLGANGPNAFDGTNANAIWTFTLDARTILVQTNSSNWLLLKGLAEASDPTNAWREITFDASTWSNAPAPFFYGDPYSNGVPAYTLLSDMRSNYSSIFLRKEFTIDNRSTVTNLFLSAQSDDGFIAWINGVEVQRYNMATGELAFNAVALAQSPEPNNNGAAYITYALTNVDSYLINGTNVLAVQAFNESLTTSSDFGFNAQLYTYLADIARTPPRLLSANPANGATVLSLRSNTFTFSEPVTGVDASDLLVNGVPATNVVTTNGILYTFRYTQPAFGPVTLTWATNHGIVDFDSPPKSFNGAAPSSTVRYTLNNVLAPLVSSQVPASGTTNISLNNINVTFTKAVVGVNASDLLVNGVPATGMISNSTTSYKFTFPQPPFGLVAISWATNHGIHDTSAAANEFDAARSSSRWNYTLIDPVPSVAITSPAPNTFLQEPASLTLRATATDNDGTISLVEFYANGQKLGEAPTAPFTYDWSGVEEGAYVLRAVATDNSGLRGTSAPVTLTIITTVPINLRRGPYLQVGTPVSGVIRWRTDIASDSVVKYGTDSANLSNSIVLPALTNEHIVQISGLQPRTQYYYSIGSSGQTLAMGTNFWFKTSPEVGTRDRTRFWVLGDSGTANNNQRAVRDSFYNYSKTNAPADFWLMLGDNAYNSGLDSEYQSAVFDMYPEALRNMFLWPTLGNHETAQAFTIADFPYLHIFTLPQNGEAGGVPSGNPRYYSYDYGNIHFISLDSMSSGRGTNTSMARWLVNDLASTVQEWTVVFFHHPPYTKGSHNSDAETELIEIRQNILPILEANGVDLVLSGHSHCYERSYLLNGHYGLSSSLTPAMKIDGGNGREDGTGAYHKNEVGQGVVYMVAGNGGQATGGTLNHAAHFLSLNELGSLVIDVVSNRMQITMLATNGVTRDQFSILKHVAIPPVPADLLARAIGTNRINLTWRDGGGNEQGYIIERSVDGINFVRVGTNGPNGTLFADLGLVPGQTYYYRVIAFNDAGESGTSNPTSDYTGNHAPVLAAIPNFQVNVLTTLRFTNVVTDADVPSNSFVFALEPGAATNARVHISNGSFAWQPTRAQAPGTNSFSIRATDNGVPPLSATQSFTVVVNDYLEVSAGHTVVDSGGTGSVPLELFSSAPLTAVSYTLCYDLTRLSNLSIETLAPSLASVSLDLSTPGCAHLTITAVPGQLLQGTQQLARLYFSALSGQISSFSALTLGDIGATRSGAGPLPSALLNDGRVVIIGAQPLVEAFYKNDGQPALMLYGKAGHTYQVETSSDLGNPSSWSPMVPIVLPTMSQLVPLPPGGPQTKFFRARE